MDDPRNKTGKRTVHIYCLVRVTINDIEAENDQDAIEKAIQMQNLGDILKKETKEYRTQYAEDIESAMVDHENDADFRWSTTYTPNNGPNCDTWLPEKP